MAASSPAGSAAERAVWPVTADPRASAVPASGFCGHVSHFGLLVAQLVVRGPCSPVNSEEF
jgi:hypothetical protein